LLSFFPVFYSNLFKDKKTFHPAPQRGGYKSCRSA
jgi:hypothetical protein